MPRIVLLLAAVFLGCAQPGSNSDAGGRADASVGDLDAGQSLTLEVLAAAWDTKACSVLACVRRTRVTPELCDRARQEPASPFSVLRRALASTDAGRATFDPDAGARCLDFIDGLDASTACIGDVEKVLPLLTPAFDAVCGEVVVGLEDAGAPCDEDWDCNGAQSLCSFSRTPDCDGRCVDLIAPNGACAERPRSLPALNELSESRSRVGAERREQ